jgi:hypothetical protein
MQVLSMDRMRETFLAMAGVSRSGFAGVARGQIAKRVFDGTFIGAIAEEVVSNEQAPGNPSRQWLR